MKIIVSHDVDHVTAFEHWRDLILVKATIRSSLELLFGSIGLSEYLLRYKDIICNKYQNIDELMSFDHENDVKSTFFVAVNHGIGLCYSLKNAEYWIKRILSNGFNVGVHGIAYNDDAEINKEYELFKLISGHNSFGIRMHYLRNDDETIDYLNQANYLFDSTVFDIINPFKVGNIWEFPLHIMDTYIFHNDSKWQNQNLAQAKVHTMEKLDLANKKNIQYLTLLFHDHYFSNCFWTWKEWYIWFIKYLKASGCIFISYADAIKELESNNSLIS